LFFDIILVAASRLHSICGCGSSKIQALSHISSSIEIEVYNGKTHRLLKLLFFICKCAGKFLTSIYITQRVLATPTRDPMNIINIWLNHSHM